MKIQAQNLSQESALPPPATLAKPEAPLYYRQSLDSAPPPRVRPPPKPVEWMGSRQFQYALPARRGRRSHGESDSGSETEMGVRVSGARTAYGQPT